MNYIATQLSWNIEEENFFGDIYQLTLAKTIWKIIKAYLRRAKIVIFIYVCNTVEGTATLTSLCEQCLPEQWTNRKQDLSQR
jgi:hypothetical protein